MIAATKLLKPREVTECKQLAQSELSDNKRATALLAIHQGQTQAQAAVTSGLSLGQVKYIVSRFRKLGMNALVRVKENPMNPVDSAAGSTISKAKKNKKKAAKKVKKGKKDKKNKGKGKDKDKDKDKDKEKNKGKDKKAKKEKKKNKKKNKNKK